MTPPTTNGPQIKGAFMRDARNWARTAYGADAYQSALAKLSDADRAIVNGIIVPGGWYPLAGWDRFLDAMRAEASARKGESEFVFDMRNMREAGGSLVVKSIYKVLLHLVGPTSAIEKAVQIYNRAYSEGRCEIIENVRGRAVVRYIDATPALLKNLSHHLPTAMVWVLEQSGAQDVAPQITRSDTAGGKLAFEVSVTYRAG
jgi:hypothetical protein